MFSYIKNLNSSAFTKTGVLALSACAYSLILAGCVAPDLVTVASTSIRVDTGPGDPTKQVCNPFNDGTTIPSVQAGLQGELYYMPNGDPNHRINYLNDLFTIGLKADATLYFNKVDVPTRRFDLGFGTRGGGVLKTPNGDTLYEYFGLKLRSVVQLGANDLPGLYQFAVISDDGAIIEVGDVNPNGVVVPPAAGTPSTFAQLVNNDGLNSSKLKVATRTISMNASTRLPFRLQYMQAPATHIAMIVLWRKVSGTADSLVEPLNGNSGNEYWFDYTRVPSVASAYYHELLSRGWKVLSEDNYTQPDEAVNPCAFPTPQPTEGGGGGFTPS